MAKHCPTCGTRFPDAANVCDQHGVALVHSSFVFQHRMRIYLALGAVAMLAAAPFAFRAYWRACLSARIVSVQVVDGSGKAGDEKDLSHWLAARNLAIKVAVKNESSIPVNAESITLTGIAVSPLELPAHASKEFEWKIPLEDAALRKMLIHPPAAGIPAEISATLRLRIVGLSFGVPYHQKLVIRPVLAL